MENQEGKLTVIIQSKPDIRSTKQLSINPRAVMDVVVVNTYYDHQKCPAKDKKCLECRKLNHFKLL